MSRRRHGSPASLELLLDTMCNAFGGVVFIAILLSILSGRAARESVPPEDLREEIDVERLRQEASRLERAIAEKTQRLRNLDLLAAAYQGHAHAQRRQLNS